MSKESDAKPRQNSRPDRQEGPSRRSRRPRGSKFNASLTTAEAVGSQPKEQKRHNKRLILPQGEDLTSNLTRGVSKAPYTECPICFAPIFPSQPTWSCSPLIEIVPISPEQSAEYCWTIFHLKCAQSWASKSFKESQTAWNARGEPENACWRCPGCQGRRNTLMEAYMCFCGSLKSPTSGLGIPHSCGNPCPRRRAHCAHPCPLQCHPGPCPPCKITISIICGCPRARTMDVRCSDNSRLSVSCGEICSRPLDCGNPEHRCLDVCHSSPCSQCESREKKRCWCGKEEREARCGELSLPWRGEVGCGVVTTTSGEVKGFSCGEICGRTFDCGVHTCQRECHPWSPNPSSCPLSPENVLTCPCGKTTISRERTTCSSPIPTCDSICMKQRLHCEHPCRLSCHAGDCPPCDASIVRPCRCGATKKTITCGSFIADDIVCDKACTALRACGRHQCNRVCCPLASLSSNAAKGKGKRRAIQNYLEEPTGGLHDCDLICGKMLACGVHRCEEQDHKGPCAPCLRSSFEELFCHCGRTVLDPPIACGTQVRCEYPCPRDAPACGHPPVPHMCHSDEVVCPPCPFLTEKLCACGKKMVSNLKCSLERDKVGCGSLCGKLLECGFHRCEKVCHAGDCGKCLLPCSKSRKLCLPLHHPCTLACHAPSNCSEDMPCRSLINLSCPCGRISQSVPCNRSTSNPAGRSEAQQQQQQPKCTPECGIAKRNAKLADALGIDTEAREKRHAMNAVYAEDLINFAKQDGKFLSLVERTFNQYVDVDGQNRWFFQF